MGNHGQRNAGHRMQSYRDTDKGHVTGRQGLRRSRHHRALWRRHERDQRCAGASGGRGDFTAVYAGEDTESVGEGWLTTGLLTRHCDNCANYY